MKRSALTRKTALKRRPWRRQVSDRKRAYEAELDAMRPVVAARSGGVCEFPECDRPATVVHHRLPRSAGGGNQIENLLHLDEHCHRAIHSMPLASYSVGALVRRGEDPATVPFGENPFIDDDGRPRVVSVGRAA